jgi:hypothetical protein
VTVSEIREDGHVSGGSSLAGIGSIEGRSSQLPGAVAALETHVSKFEDAILLAPRWRADFLAKVRGQGVADAVLQRLNTVSTVESRGTPRVDSATNVLHGDYAGYVVELAAADKEAAHEVLAEVLGDDLVGKINLIEL